MLTPAQYKALKAWPDVDMQRDLVEAGLLACRYRYGRLIGLEEVQPACNEAIREYEAAQNASSQANLSDVAETGIGKNPCPCGTQRCYPEYCDALQRYKSEKEALK